MRKESLTRVITAFGALVLIALSSLVPASAQNSNTGALHLTTSPIPVNLIAKPGQTVSTDLHITNSGEKTEVLKVGLMKFTADGEEGKPKLEDRAQGDDYFDWVHFSTTKFTAEPGVEKTIKMTIDLPKTAALGYYYAVTFTRAEEPKTQTGSNQLHGGTAILVLLDAEVPWVNRQTEVDEFSTSRKIYEFLPASFNIKLKNTGNIHLAPTGNIYIMRGKNNLATLGVNSGAGNVLPGSSRLFTAEWSDGYPHYEQVFENGKAALKDGKQVYRLKWNNGNLSKLRFGRYKAHLTLVYDNGQRDVPIEAELTFWIIPWRIIGLVLIPIVLIGLLVYNSVRLRRRLKKIEAEQEEQKVKTAKKT